MNTLQRAARVAARGINAAVAVSPLPEKARDGVAIYLLVTGCNLPGATAAAIAGCTKQNVSKLIRRVEERRDQPDFEAALTALETQLFGGE